MTSEAMEDDTRYFSRFQEGQSAHGIGVEDGRGHLHGKHHGVQEENSTVHQQFVPAKPVRLL